MDFTLPQGYVEEVRWSETVRRIHWNRAVVAELIENAPDYLGIDPQTTFDSGEPMFGCWILFFRRYQGAFEFVVSDGIFTVSFPVDTGDRSEILGLPSLIFDRIRSTAAERNIDPKPILRDLIPVGVTPQLLVAFWPTGEAQLKGYDEVLKTSSSTKNSADV